MSTGKLVLVRHGQSEWNASNQVTGWYDVPLTEKGRAEAARGGELLAAEDLLPDVLHTSLLKRAITTANLALESADRLWIPVVRDWRLNERHYGALQGLNKAETKEKYGDDQFMMWRRSYDTPPPPLADDSEFSQANDPRYANVENAPKTECLLDVEKRLIPYFEAEILPRLKNGETVMLAAHGNTLRAMLMYLDGITPEAIAEFNVPTGIPLIYEFDADAKVLNPGGTYLDPEAAAAGAAAVAAQGNK